MPKTELERQIVNFVNRPGYQPVKPREIAKQLRLPADTSQEFRQAIKKLVKKGKLSYGANHLVRAADKNEAACITGKFHRAAAGFGFVRPTGTHKSSGREEDIYIPAKDTKDAANGDTVAVRIKSKKRDDDLRVSGTVTEIKERQTYQFVGTYFEDADHGYVQVDGNHFVLPVFVGDPGAKNAKPKDKVVIEMVNFPKARRNGEAVITEVLGEHGQPGVDTLLVMREFSLPGEFPDDALDAARQAADAFDETNLDGRRDLTETTVITIDPADARDFDDAISLRKIEKDHWVLGVHIADVSHFVRPKSALDAEARNRATSIYLPDRVIPMLPEIISNNLASLQPDRVRYTKTVFIEFTPDGARVATDACSAAIKSDRRFTYEEVDEYLANPADWRSKITPEVHDLLARMHEFAMILRRRRLEHGSIELSMREVKIDLDDDGHVVGAHGVENTVSHQIIEEFMLAANMAVAEMLRDREIKFLRRIHENPDPRRLKTLTQFVRHLGFEVESLESRFEIKKLLAQVEGQPAEYAINYAVLRSLQKAVYSPEDFGHYALASDCYCHFTSPIRRYPDLTVHRLIEDIERGKTPGHSFGYLLQLGDHCSQREQRAEKSERELTKLKLLNFLRTRIGHKMEAVVTGVESFGLFVLGLEIPAEGLVHIHSIEDDHYDYDDATHAIYGRRKGLAFSLGDVVEVEIALVDMDRRELDLRLIRQIKPRELAPKDHQSSGPSRSAANNRGSNRRGREKPAGKKPPGNKAKHKGKAGKSKSKKR